MLPLSFPCLRGQTHGRNLKSVVFGEKNMNLDENILAATEIYVCVTEDCCICQEVLSSIHVALNAHCYLCQGGYALPGMYVDQSTVFVILFV